MTRDTFEAVEQAGWTAKAHAYDDLFARISNQAIEPTLDSFGSLVNRRLLDVACGPGHIAGSARSRGARSEGVDYAPTMLAKARSHYADATFTQGNAERLPHRDASFDAVICGFGMLHFAQPADILELIYTIEESNAPRKETKPCLH